MKRERNLLGGKPADEHRARGARIRGHGAGRPADEPSGVATQRPRSALEAFSMQASEWAGSSRAFALAVGVIAIWAVTGPVFRFSDTWQLVINTGTTVVTFLMVFLIQRAQNKESKAIQLKLDEIVAALAGASNRLIDAEDLSEEEIAVLRRHYAEISRSAQAPEEPRDALPSGEDQSAAPGRGRTHR